MAGSFIFGEIGIEKIKSRRRDVVKDKFLHKVISFRKPRCHRRAGVYLPPHCPALSIPGAPPRTPSAFLKESGAKNLLFFDIAGSFIFGEIGIEKNKEQKKRCCIR